MDKTPFLVGQIFRDYDLNNISKDAQKGLAWACASILGQVGTVVNGFDASPTDPASLSVDLANGWIYQLADIDAAAIGDFAADSNQILQQGFTPPQTIALNTSGLSAGQSQWWLIQAEFQQIQQVRPGDPTGGVEAFYNTEEPADPLDGIGGEGGTCPTVVMGFANVSAVAGVAATSGSAVPPSPSGGCTPLFLVELSHGQTSITSGDIQIAGPGAYSDYQQAPFLAGLLNQHHLGIVGQAPQIDLTKEVQNKLPYANMNVTNPSPPATGGVVVQGGLIPIETIVDTNPNGNAAGQVGDLAIDESTNTPYWCSTEGDTDDAEWTALTGGLQPINVTTAPCVASNINALYSCSYAGNLAFTLPTLSSSTTGLCIVENNNAYVVTVGPAAGQTINGSSDSVSIAGQGSAVAFYKDPSSSTNWLSYVLGANNLIGTANPNSVQAGTAGQFFYDATNDVNYICTTSGGASSAVWTRLTEPVGTLRTFSPAAAGTNTIPTGYSLCDGGTYNGVTVPNMIGVLAIGSQPTGSSSPPNPNGFGDQAVDTTVGATTHSHSIPILEALPEGGGSEGNVLGGTNTGSTAYLPSAYGVVWTCRTL